MDELLTLQEKAPFKAEDVARILQDHMEKNQAGGPVTFAIDKLLVNREEGAAASVDVYYTVTYGEKTLNGFTAIEYEEFREEAGGFTPLFNYIAKGLFTKIKGARS